MVDAAVVVKTKILRGNEIVEACIGIDNGTITAVKHFLSGEKEYDYSRFLTMPGGVDTHTHMREPGMTQKEDFDTGTASAAFGGTTTIIDMPNTIPEVTDSNILREKAELVSGKANVDFGLMARLSKTESIEQVAKTAIGFKFYMSETTGTESADGLETLLVSQHLAGKVITVHAEDPVLFQDLNCTSLRIHNINRNIETERSAVETVVQVDTKGTVNLAHLTTPESAALAREKKVNYEVTPHHLLLDDNADLGALGKVNPPLRHESISKALLEDLIAGRVNVIASDHAPHTIEEKLGGFSQAPSGVPGVETRIPLMMGLASKSTISFEIVQDTCCTRPARLFNLRKGEIREGYDADLAVFDLDAVVKVKGQDLHSKCGWTPFEGHDAVFPTATFLRGKLIMADRNLKIRASGKMLQC